MGLVSWCFQCSQPLGIISRLKTMFYPSLSYSVHKTIKTNHNISTAQLEYFIIHTRTHTHTQFLWNQNISMLQLKYFWDLWSCKTLENTDSRCNHNFVSVTEAQTHHLWQLTLLVVPQQFHTAQELFERRTKKRCITSSLNLPHHCKSLKVASKGESPIITRHHHSKLTMITFIVSFKPNV